MQLVFQVAGALAAGLVILALARTCGLSGSRATGSVAVVSIVVAALLGLPNLRDAIAIFREQHEVDVTLNPLDRRLGAGVTTQMNVSFLVWAEERIAEDETFSVVTGRSLHQQQARQWSLFQLAPRLSLANRNEADWVVFYEVRPAVYASPTFTQVQVYEPGFAIARPADAG